MHPEFAMAIDHNPLDVEGLISQLTLEEKIDLLAGQGSFRTTGLPHRGIPSLIVSCGALRSGVLAVLPKSRHQTVLMEFEVAELSIE